MSDPMETINAFGQTEAVRMYWMLYNRMMELNEEEATFNEAIELAEQLLMRPDLPLYYRARCLMVLSCNPEYPESAVQLARQAVELLDTQIRELVASHNGSFPQDTLNDARRLLREAEEDYEEWLEELRVESEQKKMLKANKKKAKSAAKENKDEQVAESSAAKKNKNEPVVESSAAAAEKKNEQVAESSAAEKKNEQVAESSATSVQQTGDAVAETASGVARMLKDQDNVFAGAGTPPRSARKRFEILSPTEVAALPILQQTLQRSRGMPNFSEELERQARGQPAYLTPQVSNASQIEIPGDEEQEKSQRDRDGDESMD